MSKRSHRASFGGGATCSPLIARVLDTLNKFNRIFDKKSNSNILHGYSSCSTLEGEPKSMISMGGKMSPCCGLLRHFVEKISHLGVNVPHNDMEICSIALKIRERARVRVVPAFTLTEVLLAVLIVGIIAALVLPAVVTKYQDKVFESAFNREVHSLQDSIDSLAAVENQQSFYETTLAKTPETYMKKYLRVSKYCGASGKDCFGKFYSEYSDHEKKTYTPSYDGNCAILKNGTSVCLNVNGGNIAMLIDVNGPKGPNVWGRDLRTYTHSVKGKTGYDMSSNGIISLNQTPIEDNDSDPCEGKTCGCGDLPDCETDPCATDNNSLACCRKRTITGTSDKCCQYSEFSSSTVCTPAPKTVSAYCTLSAMNRSELPSSYSSDDFFWLGPKIRIMPTPSMFDYSSYQSVFVKGEFELNGSPLTVTCSPNSTIKFSDEAICLGPEVSSYELYNKLVLKSCTLYIAGVAVDSVSGNAVWGAGLGSLSGILIKK